MAHSAGLRVTMSNEDPSVFVFSGSCQNGDPARVDDEHRRRASIASSDTRLPGDLDHDVFRTLRRRVTGLPCMCLREITQIWRHRRLRRLGIVLDWTTLLVGHCEISTGRMTIGPRSVIRTSLLDGRGGLEIGHDVFLDQATVLTADHDVDDPEFRTMYRQVVIEPYVLIFRKAIVLPGTRIGFGAVVGAGSIVTKNVPEMAVVAGAPAQIVRRRRMVHSQADLRRMSGYAAHCWRSYLPKRS